MRRWLGLVLCCLLLMFLKLIWLELRWWWHCELNICLALNYWCGPNEVLRLFSSRGLFRAIFHYYFALATYVVVRNLLCQRAPWPQVQSRG